MLCMCDLEETLLLKGNRNVMSEHLLATPFSKGCSILETRFHMNR